MLNQVQNAEQGKDAIQVKHDEKSAGGKKEKMLNQVQHDGTREDAERSA